MSDIENFMELLSLKLEQAEDARQPTMQEIREAYQMKQEEIYDFLDYYFPLETPDEEEQEETDYEV